METKKIKVTVSLDMLQRARDYVERCRNQVIVDEDIEAWIDEYDRIIEGRDEDQPTVHREIGKIMINGREVGKVTSLHLSDAKVRVPEPIDMTNICTNCWREVIEYGNRLCRKCKEEC